MAKVIQSLFLLQKCIKKENVKHMIFKCQGKFFLEPNNNCTGTVLL